MQTGRIVRYLKRCLVNPNIICKQKTRKEKHVIFPSRHSLTCRYTDVFESGFYQLEAFCFPVLLLCACGVNEFKAKVISKSHSKTVLRTNEVFIWMQFYRYEQPYSARGSFLSLEKCRSSFIFCNTAGL